MSLRYVFETPLKIRLLRGSGTRIVGGWARDISDSGVGAFVAEELILGEQVELEVPFPGEVTLTLYARVSRNLGTQYGLMFTALSAADRRLIHEWIADKPPLPRPKLP